jgi:hypothetical protein
MPQGWFAPSGACHGGGVGMQAVGEDGSQQVKQPRESGRCPPTFATEISRTAHPTRFFLSVGLRLIALNCEASKFRGGGRVPSECAIGCSARRRLVRFQRIRRKSHFENSTTAESRINKIIPLVSKNACQRCSMFSSRISPLGPDCELTRT